MSLARGSAVAVPVTERTGLRAQVIRFAGVGVVSTVVHLGLFAVMAHAGWPSLVANAVALALATLLNTALNRRWTFGVSGRERLATHHGQALLIFAITWVATSLALALLGVVAPNASPMVQTMVVAVANVASTALRFLAMRRWIFRS